MLEKFLAKPVELSIDDKVISFSTIDDFEFSLSARTAISSDRITEMISASTDELTEELKAIGVAKYELGRLVSQSPESSSGINMRLKSIDTAIFSKEHSWRDIFIALNSYESLPMCKYKNIALKLYIRYLGNRLKIAKNIKNELEIKRKTVNQEGVDTGTETIMSIPHGLSTIESDVDILNSELDLVRISKDSPIILEMDEGETIEIYVSKYKCKLIEKNGIKFIDTDDVEYPLELGENKIGRGKGCNVKLSGDMREISRSHLLIVNYDHSKLKLTDLSAKGTYLPQRHIK